MTALNSLRPQKQDLLLRAGLAAGAFALALLLGSCTPAAPQPAPTASLPATREPTLTPDTPTPDQGATEDAARFAATVQAYQTETAAQKATQRAAGTDETALLPLTADNLDRITLLDSFETDGIYAAHFTSDGQYAVLLTEENTLVIDLARQAAAAEIPGDAFERLAFGPDGRFAGEPRDGDFLLFNIGSDPIPVDGLHENPTTAAYSPDGRWIIIGSEEGSIGVVDPRTGSLAHLLTPADFSANPSASFPLGFSPDGRTAAVFFYNLSGLWIGETASLVSGSPSGILIPWLDHAGPIADVRISPDWQHLAWFSRGTLQIMTIDGSPVGDPLGSDIIQNPVFLPDGDTLIVTANRAVISEAAAGNIRAVDLNTGTLRYELEESDRVSVLALSPDGRRAAAGFDNGGVMLFDPQTGQVIERSATTGSPVTGLAFNPAGSLLAVLRNDGTVEIGPEGSGTAIPLPDSVVYGIGFDHTGRRLVVILELESGEVRFYGVRP